ncbi:MAG: hypothetical protein BMS9Abin11_1838 [Gammaproteobacteria bacterium]|nr:MAG: hypothetical protein BMS9Abin11_1838 [Gammaproteobacteria bacterium]
MGTPRHAKKAAKKATELQKELIDAQAEEGTPLDEAVIDQEKPPVEPAPVEPPKADEYKTRFINLKTKWDSEVPDMRKDLAGAGEKIDDLTNQLKALTEKLEKQADQASDNTEQAVSAITDSEMEEFGPNLIALITRIANSAGGNKDAAKKILELEKEIGQLKDGHKQVTERQELTGKELFFKELTDLVPDWKKINVDVDFQAWLSEDMPGTREERQYYLQKAANEFDHEKAAEMFNLYMKRGEGSVPTPPDDEPEKDDDLEDQIIPDSSKASTVVTENAGEKGKKVWTRKEISRFYSDKSKGLYKRKEDEARRIEKDIHAASQEGRIR